MRISDWSSDVCSSDLHVTADAGRARPSWDRSASTRRTGGPFSSHDPADGSIQWPGSRCRRYAGEGDRSARKQRHRTAWRIFFEHRAGDRKSVVSGKSVSVRVDLGGRRIIKKKKIIEHPTRTTDTQCIITSIVPY